MDSIEALSLTIASSDLRYVSGSIVGATVSGSVRPKAWPFSQWGSLVALEAQNHVRNAHGVTIDLGWDPVVAASARHSGKFSDDTGLKMEGVAERFGELLRANYRAFFPERRSEALDDLRNDLSVIMRDGEVLLTSVSGLFMQGVTPEIAVDFDALGRHAHRLSLGMGQAAAAFTGSRLDEIKLHGNNDLPPATWQDAKSFVALPASFAGAFDPPVAFSLLTILSTVQTARFWGRANCCAECSNAALKHRFVVLYQACSSIARFSLSSHPNVRAEVADLLNSDDSRTILSPSFRRLRNGLVHLGLGDVAARLPAAPDLGHVIVAYTGMEPADFDDLVDRGLSALAAGLNSWALSPAPDGARLTDGLVTPR